MLRNNIPGHVTGNTKEAIITGLINVNSAAVACDSEDTITFVDANDRLVASASGETKEITLTR